eukprot:GHVL01042838.1.p1 GENE.GHVL01042838.1~~GHVL01042838.1.p1  ORF type:complete len:272 (+),score=22.01 GHVL01042838.1:45-860(+)
MTKLIIISLVIIIAEASQLETCCSCHCCVGDTTTCTNLVPFRYFTDNVVSTTEQCTPALCEQWHANVLLCTGTVLFRSFSYTIDRGFNHGGNIESNSRCHGLVRSSNTLHFWCLIAFVIIVIILIIAIIASCIIAKKQKKENEQQKVDRSVVEEAVTTPKKQSPSYYQEQSLGANTNAYTFNKDGYCYDQYGYCYDKNGYCYDPHGYCYDQQGQVVSSPTSPTRAPLDQSSRPKSSNLPIVWEASGTRPPEMYNAGSTNNVTTRVVHTPFD